MNKPIFSRREWLIAGLLLLIFLRFCGGSENYLVIGSAFVLSGVIFFAVNFFCSRWMAKDREAAV